VKRHVILKKKKFYDTVGKLPAIHGSHPHHNHKEMCFMNILYYSEPGISTKNPFVRGKCTQEQSKSFPVDSTRLLPDNRILTEHVISGNHTGIVRITEDISVNLVIILFHSRRYAIIIILTILLGYGNLFERSTSGCEEHETRPTR